MKKLSTKGRYATRALLDIALHTEKNPTPLKEIAKRQEISVQYLEHLIGPLISAGMINSVRGSKGGVVLVKPPSEIKISEVIRIMEGSTALVACVDDSGVCPRSDSCVTRDVWAEIKKATDAILENITLQGLIERQKEKDQSSVEMFFI